MFILARQRGVLKINYKLHCVLWCINIYLDLIEVQCKQKTLNFYEWYIRVLYMWHFSNTTHLHIYMKTLPFAFNLSNQDSANRLRFSINRQQFLWAWSCRQISEGGDLVDYCFKLKVKGKIRIQMCKWMVIAKFHIAIAWWLILILY